MAICWLANIYRNVLIPVLTTLACLAAILLGAAVAPPGGECESRFMQDLFSCFNEFNVPFNTYLYVVGNGSGGVAPGNQTLFKQQMCSVEEDVVRCSLDSLHQLVKTSVCDSGEGMASLLTVQVRTVFEQYDNYCSHECRQTLEDDMRQCYTDLDLDPSLFLSSDSSGALLGQSPSAVNDFCQNREKLVTCLNTEKDACPEAPYVMQRLGLDLNTLSSGFKILCRDEDVYLASLDCFESQTRAVEKCQEDRALSLLRLASRTKSQTASVSQQSFINQFCLAGLQFLKCDMTAWSVKGGRACSDPAVLSLKRDLHCSQLPQVCHDILPGPVRQVCTFDWTKAADKASMSGGPGLVFTPHLMLACLVLMVTRFSR